MGDYGEHGVKEGSFLEYFYNKWQCVPEYRYNANTIDVHMVCIRKIIKLEIGPCIN